MKIFANCCKNLHFVCNLGSRRYYIQSAYSLPTAEKIEQEVRPFRKIDDSFKKIIVTKDIVPAVYDENGDAWSNINPKGKWVTFQKGGHFSTPLITNEEIYNEK